MNNQLINDEAARNISPCRAAEILAYLNNKQYGAELENPITQEEDRLIHLRWTVMAGTTCYADAVNSIRRPELYSYPHLKD